MTEWVWHGHAAHFIAAARCRFHLATTVAGGRFVVSTVGDYFPRDDVRETIGLTRYFETMVFPVDGVEDCGCSSISDYQEHDFMGYQTAQEATAGHLALCHKWDARTEEEA